MRIYDDFPFPRAYEILCLTQRTFFDNENYPTFWKWRAIPCNASSTPTLKPQGDLFPVILSWRKFPCVPVQARHEIFVSGAWFNTHWVAALVRFCTKPFLNDETWLAMLCSESRGKMRQRLLPEKATGRLSSGNKMHCCIYFRKGEAACPTSWMQCRLSPCL